MKIRGYRIEPGEIEAALVRRAGVAQAAVVGREVAAGELRLVAYVVPEAEQKLDLKVVRRDLALELPEYMVPGAFVVLERLPLTANGKLDKKALPEAEGTGLEAGYVAPETAEGVLLCELVAELLGVERVGLGDNFFLLGGHSLLATRLAAQVRSRLGRELPIRTIFEKPVLGDLAEALRTLNQPVCEVAPLVANASEAHAPFPLTPVQEAYWLGRQGLVELGEVACHLYIELKLSALDLECFTWAWRAVIERHPMLRVVLEPNGTQRVLPEVAPLTIPLADYSDRPWEEAQAAAHAVRERMSHQILPCERWPLFELRVTQIDSTDWRLHLSIDALMLDGESTSLLLREVFDLYHHGPPGPGIAPELSFRDYVLHLKAQSAEADQARAYWQGRLDTLPAAPVLPLAVEPSRLKDPRFARQHARLDAMAWSALKARAFKAGLTPSSVLLSSYAEVVGTWARSDDFTLNLTVGDRRPLHPQVASMLGVFTNLIPLEIRGACRGSLRERAKAQQRQLALDLDHRAVSGVEVQRMLAQRAGDPRAGLLPVVFTSVLGEAGVELPDGISIIYSITQTPQTWLDNKVYEIDGELGIDWDAPVGLFPPGLLDTMFGAYVRLLRELAASDGAWDAIERSLVPEAQYALLAEVNATAGPLPGHLLHEPVFAAAAANPEAIALIGHDDYSLSYGELMRRVLWLARKLQSSLRAEDKLVAIVMEKGFEQIVAALAVLESGRAFLPISADQPSARIQAILPQAGVGVALVQPYGRGDWQEEIILIEVTQQQQELATGTLPPRLSEPSTPQDPAYVIYTSGSTGIPKGVTIQHCAACNTLADLSERFAITHTDRVLWVSSFEFDLSIFDLFGILGVGGTVIVAPRDGKQNPIAWAEAVQRHRVTIWNSVPALADLMLTSAGARAASLLRSLRLMMLSGDWIPVSLPDRFKKQVPDCALYSLGGATEASIWSIFHPVDRVEPDWTSIPYGKPLRNQSFHIFKPDLSPCPVHTTGKLFIGGAGLAMGYWNDPQQTSARFIRHPLTAQRLYDTGDLGRYRPDGTIEFLGREDNQVKLRGFRIELGEIEATLRKHPQVQQAVALVQKRHQTNTIVAYVVPKQTEQEKIDSTELSAWVSMRLPDYMLPRAFVVLGRLPLTPNGKLDRQALPESDGSTNASDYLAPGTPTEILICQLVAELLGLERVGLEDNFFRLGGDSISSIRLVSRARACDLQITPRDIFLNPTLGALASAAKIESDGMPPAADAADTGDPLSAGQISGELVEPGKEEFEGQERSPQLEDIWPLTPLQEGLFFHALYGIQGQDPYLVQLGLELQGEVDTWRLRRALDALLERHASLRAFFRQDRHGHPVQFIPLFCAMPWCEHDLTGLDQEDCEGRAKELEAQDRQIRFVLDQAPLIRATLLKLGKDSYRLLLTQHHLLCDGWSGSIMLEDLLALYRSNGDPPFLTPSTFIEDLSGLV
jgi:amino acid adenylation domain-containing protein